MIHIAAQVVPILRAGLVMVEQISTVLPAQVTYHVGLVRNEETLQVQIILQQAFPMLCENIWVVYLMFTDSKTLA